MTCIYLYVGYYVGMYVIDGGIYIDA